MVSRRKRLIALACFLTALVLLVLAAGLQLGLAADLTLTPGVVRDLSVETICKTKWGRDRRLVTAAMKRQVFENYGLKGNADASQGCKLDKHGRRYEVDHLVPRCAGGADDVKNLWPQCYSGEWNAVMKDRLEVLACKKICKGELSVKEAQALFADWQESYRQFFGEP